MADKLRVSQTAVEEARLHWRNPAGVPCLAERVNAAPVPFHVCTIAPERAAEISLEAFATAPSVCLSRSEPDWNRAYARMAVILKLAH